LPRIEARVVGDRGKESEIESYCKESDLEFGLVRVRVNTCISFHCLPPVYPP
jgi:hypothetical protein